MEEEKTSAKTTFDSIFENHQLEIIKAAIPYINTSEQKFMSIFIKFSELRDTITILRQPEADMRICSLENKDGTMMDMLNDMMAVCTNAEKDTLNMVINFLNAFQLFQTYQDIMEFDTSSTDSSTDSSQNNTTSNNMFDTLKELLTPEQQTMFNTYSALFSS